MATNSTRPVGETVIEIPGEPGFLKTVDLPPQFLPLPLKAGARFQPLAALSGLLGLFLLFGAMMVLVGIPLTDQSIWAIAGMSAAGLFMAAAAICFTGAALTAIVDDSRRYPVLVIDEPGIWDKRSVQAPLAWSDTAHAKVVYTKVGVAGVQLKLRHTIEASHNPFRLGTLGFSWRRRPDELYVSVMGLDAKPRLLALAITTMVQRNGGAIATKHP